MGISDALLSLITWKSQPERTPEAQQAADQAARQLMLYHFPTCPFCLRVRRVIRQLKLNIELRDAANQQAYQQELRLGGGRLQTPCLRIQRSGQQDEWLYESADIIRYLKQRFTIQTAV